MARQYVEDDIGRMHAVGEGLGAGCLDSSQTVAQYRRQDPDHLAIAVIRALQAAPHTLQIGGQ